MFNTLQFLITAAAVKKRVILNAVILASVTSLFINVPAAAKQVTNPQAGDTNQNQDISPARKINHPPQRALRAKQRGHQGRKDEFRAIDGSNNNLQFTTMGTPHSQLFRLMGSDYDDEVSTMAGSYRPSARIISNLIFSQFDSIPNSLNASDYLWQWGQFLDHDIDLTDGADPLESANIPVPAGDTYFDPEGTGSEEIALNRSIYDTSSGVDNPRQQLNEVTTWIDASNIYGSNLTRANALRTLAGDGKLKTSEGNLLPFNTEGLANAGGGSSSLFLAGDVRANEQVALTAMHTLFMREHNRLASLIAEENPQLSGEQIYQKARKLVGAEMQLITYREYLPALLGPGSISPYRGYQASVDASIANIFSTAAYRYGHSALNSTLQRIDKFGQPSIYGHLALRDAFFNPSRIIDEGGIDPVLRGLAKQAAQAVDTRVIDDVRNFLFGAPGSGGFDLVSLNIQRGRDHGLPSYNDVREILGFSRALNFADISSDPDTQARLALAYSSVDGIDLWVGGLSEDPVPRSHVGPLFHSIIKDQFEALRDGDRYWYAVSLSRKERKMVQRLRLSDIIRLNTDIGNEINNDVFHVDSPGRGNPFNQEKRKSRIRK